ncbi:unnamed protein product [Nesidiocoris tenuis]|nr:unnamed protein product [Nesidiocoris tenuis]
MEILGIKFAPLNVPFRRRMETLAALSWICTPTFVPLISLYIFCYVLLFTKYYWLPLLYLIFLYLDFDQPHQGGRSIELVRNVPWWKLLTDYFPLTLVKTCELPPDRNYLFCFYPHGVLSLNATAHFTTNGTNFKKQFPGLKRYLATLDAHFRTPLIRDILLGLGLVSSSKRSLLNVLGSEEKGRAIALMLGGAQEALYAKPGSYKTVLKKRKGFIKIALRTGASLVPVYAFGENDLYDQLSNPPGSFLFKVQEFVKKVTGFAPVIPLGRGVFQYSFGLIPQRRPIHTVVGKPIHLKKTDDFSEEMVESIHKNFTEELIALFEEHKHKYIENADDIHLEITE